MLIFLLPLEIKWLKTSPLDFIAIFKMNFLRIQDDVSSLLKNSVVVRGPYMIKMVHVYCINKLLYVFF